MAYDPSNPPATPNKYISAASTNTQVLVAGPCTLTLLALGSQGTSAVSYVKLFDKATQPVLGTDVPVQTYMIPGNFNGAGSNISPPGGLKFANGLAIAITGGMVDTDTTAVAAGQVVVNYGTRS